MARTVKTTPWWVRMVSARPTLARENHDHRNGICELDAHRGPDHDDIWVRPGACRLEPSALLLYGPNSGCGCRMCTDYYGRRHARRQDRHQAHRLCRRIEQALAASLDLDELD